MTGHHSPWPLFCDDLDLARSWLRPQLQGFVPLRTGHVAISLGLGDMLLDSVGAGKSKADTSALQQWHFRMARMHGEANPYRHLLPKGVFEQTLDAIDQSKTMGLPLGVQLNGGIGDHLEALSLLLPWAKAQNCRLNLQMDTERQNQIEPLLRQWDQVQCKTSSEQGANSIPVMALRAAVASNKETSQYKAWLPQPGINEPKEQNWLCCWRAEGAGDKLSAHSRSVPWILARKFYGNLYLHNPQSRIVDITNWKSWEASQLKGMGVTTINPRQGTLLALAKLCRASRVVTIDTALVHLCAAAGQQADLLLNAFPDERWQELHRPEHNYGQLIRLWRSSQFGSWSTVLASLTSSLATKD